MWLTLELFLCVCSCQQQFAVAWLQIWVNMSRICSQFLRPSKYAALSLKVSLAAVLFRLPSSLCLPCSLCSFGFLWHLTRCLNPDFIPSDCSASASCAWAWACSSPCCLASSLASSWAPPRCPGARTRTGPRRRCAAGKVSPKHSPKSMSISQNNQRQIAENGSRRSSPRSKSPGTIN